MAIHKFTRQILNGGRMEIYGNGSSSRDYTYIDDIISGMAGSLEKINEGYDIVSGWRVNRKDKAVTRRFPSAVANKIISKLTGVYLHDYGCTLKAYREKW